MNKKLAVVVGLVITFLIGVVVGATIVGVIEISYIIEPSPAGAVTLDPNPVTLNLGTILGGAVETINFGNCCRVTLSAGYKVWFELDLETIEDFIDLDVRIRIYKAGITYDWTTIYLGETDNINYATLDSGDHDIHIQISYEAPFVTETTTGEVEISISY